MPISTAILLIGDIIDLGFLSGFILFVQVRQMWWLFHSSASAEPSTGRLVPAAFGRLFTWFGTLHA